MSGSGLNSNSPQTQVSLKPEDVVFRTDSDSRSVIVVTPSQVLYASEGRYGGYILRGELPEEPFRAFYVEPTIRETSYSDSLVELISKELGKEPTSIEKIIYNYIEVNVEVKKKTDKYTIIEFKPKKGGMRLTAEAIRVEWHWQGSAKYPESTTAKRKYQELVFKYPELEDVVYCKTYTGYRGRGSTIYYKRVISAPKELIPEVKTTETKKSKILEKLERLAEELEEEEKEEKVEVTKEDVYRYLESKGLVPVKLVTFDLPTEYKGARTTYEKSEDGKVIEKKTFSVDPTRYRSLRRKFYAVLERGAFKTTAGWILTSRANLKELNNTISELNKLAGTSRNIWIIETYMPKDYVENQLEQYIKSRELALKEIEQKLQLEKLKESQKKRLQRRLEELSEVVKALREELRRLRR